MSKPSQEREQLDLFRALPGDMAPRDSQDLMAFPFFSLAKSRRTAPIDFQAGGVTIRVEGTQEHGIATIWDADVLIWAASQIVEARDAGLRPSRLMQATPYEILRFIGRGTSLRDYQRLKAALDRLQSTTVATSIRETTGRRLHRFSWINEWKELADANGTPQGYAPPGHDPENARRKEAEAAAASSVFFRSGGQRAAAVPTQVAAAAPGALAPGLAGFDPLATGPDSTAVQPADPAAVQNRQDQKEAFLKGGSAETRNSGNLQMPASPYQVMAGTVIAAALVTGIKSDLPGDVIATVTEPVYDTATGKFLLIPQGSRILGRYNSQVSYGQSRVQMVWNRIILPDTSSLTLDNIVGTDSAGYAGLEDEVDRHWGRILAGAALTTLLGVGAELAAPENRQDGNRIVIAGRDGLQDSVNQVGQELTRRKMNIQPTLTARPGLPVRVIVARDLVLRPYQPMFFQRGVMR